MTSSAANSLFSAVSRVLRTPGPRDKAKQLQTLMLDWKSKPAGDEHDELDPALTSLFVCGALPARPSSPVLLDTRSMPSHKQLNIPIVQYLLHGLAHIELNAMDMYCDTLLAGMTDSLLRHHPGQAEFIHDFITVAEDESRHYVMLEDRLMELGSHYGAMPARECIHSLLSPLLCCVSMFVSCVIDRHSTMGSCCEHIS